MKTPEISGEIEILKERQKSSDNFCLSFLCFEIKQVEKMRNQRKIVHDAQ